MLKRTLIAVSAAAALAAVAPIPALAGTPSSGGDVNVSATVNPTETISLTGLSSTITFPAVTAGNTATDDSAENYTVSLTGGAGYTLTISTGGTGLSDTAGDSISNQEMSILETTFGSGWNNRPFPLGGGQPAIGSTPGPSTVTLDQESTGSPTGDISMNYSENWQLDVPATTPAGTYTEAMTYLALANS
jgi:hypothetical protein